MNGLLFGLAISILFWWTSYVVAIKYRDEYRRPESGNFDRYILSVVVFFSIFIIHIIVRGAFDPHIAPSSGMSAGPSVISAFIFYHFSGSSGAGQNSQKQDPGGGLSSRPVSGSRGSSDTSTGCLVDPYEVAGQEVMSGKVVPSLWARALAERGDELTVRGTSVNLRVAELETQAAAAAQAEQERKILHLTAADEEASRAVRSKSYRFSEAELSVYGREHLNTLGGFLRSAPPSVLRKTRDAICKKIGWVAGKGDERAFLEAFYAQLREHLAR